MDDLQLILSQDLEDAWSVLTTKPERKVELEEIEKQLDPDQHSVFDLSVRPDKTVKKVDGKNSDGSDRIVESTQAVNRIAIPMQELIVNRAVGFTLGFPVELKADAEEGGETELRWMVQKVWDDNKLKYKDRALARTLFSETEAAELWYFTADEEYWEKDSIKLRPKIKLLKPSEGNNLIPKFNEYGDLVMFSREYAQLRSIEGVDVEIEILEVWTTEKHVVLEKGEDGIEIVVNEANLLKKIPVIYYSQPYPEWYKVQVMIDRLETLLSNFGDTNDYFGSPMVFVQGAVTGFAAKGEQGKVLQGEKGATAQYLSWDSAPDAIKLEIETLIELIHTSTQTPNISFSQMKGLGNLSGVALKLMFLDAHMKVENKIEVLGEMFQRRINLLKRMCVIADISLEQYSRGLEIEPVFRPYMPRNEKEDIETLTTATGGRPVMSQRTAMTNNSFVVDVDREIEYLEEEEKAASTRQTFEF